MNTETNLRVVPYRVPNIQWEMVESQMNQYYEIMIRGHLTPQWAEIFDGMEVSCLPDGNTRIAGYMPDQSTLYGLLMHLRDLGLTLLSVQMGSSQENRP